MLRKARVFALALGLWAATPGLLPAQRSWLVSLDPSGNTGYGINIASYDAVDTSPAGVTLYREKGDALVSESPKNAAFPTAAMSYLQSNSGDWIPVEVASGQSTVTRYIRVRSVAKVSIKPGEAELRTAGGVILAKVNDAGSIQRIRDLIGPTT
jgi:hypothetical protein